MPKFSSEKPSGDDVILMSDDDVSVTIDDFLKPSEAKKSSTVERRRF
jgi:hypothetical protein